MTDDEITAGCFLRAKTEEVAQRAGARTEMVTIARVRDDNFIGGWLWQVEIRHAYKPPRGRVQHGNDRSFAVEIDDAIDEAVRKYQHTIVYYGKALQP